MFVGHGIHGGSRVISVYELWKKLDELIESIGHSEELEWIIVSSCLLLNRAIDDHPQMRDFHYLRDCVAIARMYRGEFEE